MPPRETVGNGLSSCDSRAFEDDVNATFYVSDIYAGPAVTVRKSSDGSVATNMAVALSMSPSGTLIVPTGKVLASCVLSGATLCYTTDGMTPTASSPELSGSLTLTEDTTVTVAAFLDCERVLTKGAKVKATGDSLYLGVIRQEGASGFYGMTVSED